MADLTDIIAYVLDQYPSQISDELSNARLTKIVYLSDWKCCLDQGRQISNISWVFDNHGPYVHDVIDTVKRNGRIFQIEETNNMYGSTKRIIKRSNSPYYPKLRKSEKKIIDAIIDITRKMYWAEFISVVYGTYPITSSNRYAGLNLVRKAKEYKSSP